MITLGVVLMVLGFVLGVPLIWSVGAVLAVVGLVLFVAGSAKGGSGARRHYW